MRARSRGADSGGDSQHSRPGTSPTASSAQDEGSAAPAAATVKQDLDAHVRARHQRAARRPGRPAPLPRARGRASGRGHHRARGQAGASRSSATSPARRCGASTSCGSCTAGSTRPCRSATTAARCASSSTTADPAVLPAGFRLGDNDTRILAVALQPAGGGRRRHAGLQGPADAGQGVGGRAWPPRSTAPSWRSRRATPA